MANENILTVVLLVIGIIVVVNGMLFLSIRGLMRGNKTTRKFFDSARDTFSQPFQKEDKSLEELRKRVEDLKK